ncbi:MAG: AAA family ATPase, partial [Bacteroidales bacterium]|nr:AAA family ATPase [Candidatus Physcocola equi]
MGIYLNPNAEAFKEDKNTDIYVDKSLVLTELNKLLGSRGKFVCMSRARRFGKSMAGNMISAYYSKGCDTKEIFSKMKIGDVPGYEDNLNKFNVIKLDLNGWYNNTPDRKLLFDDINESLREEFEQQFSNVRFKPTDNLARCILRVYAQTNQKFVFIIDEYDVLVREKVSNDLFQKYLDFLNGLFKDATLRPAISLAYITGILPIVRDKVQSKLNEFTEYSMVDAQQFAGLIGFTREEVDDLCNTHGIDREECARWYDGYKLSESVGVFNPLSVVNAVRRKEFGSYWSATSTFEVLKDYISMNFDGIREDIISMMSGTPVPVKVKDFRNTLDDITNKDNVFTYLIHLGYLSYDRKTKTCKIPNEEVREEWVSAIDYDDNYVKVIEI